MRIVLAFDSFKGCMTATEACEAAAAAIRQFDAPTLREAEVVQCPLSDGGEGLVDCVEQMLSTRRIHFAAHDPLMNIMDASYVVTEDGSTAYMEMAATSGLTLVPSDKQNPMLTTTYGVGDMMVDAVRRGCQTVVMGIGGSATCDGGQGMVQCLMDKGCMAADGSITDGDLLRCRFLVASDVTNPLYGQQGAAFVFAPQKGATPEQVILLDNQLRTFAQKTERLGLANHTLSHRPGAGAAGGLGYGLMAYLKAELRSGIDIMLDILKFDNLLTGTGSVLSVSTATDTPLQQDDKHTTTLVITGEGKSDEQTLMGKVPYGVWRRCHQHGIPVWLLSGNIDDPHHHLLTHFSLVKSINEGDTRPLDILMLPSVARQNLQHTLLTTLHEFGDITSSKSVHYGEG